MDSSEPDQDLPQGYPQQVLVDETRDLDAVFEGPNSFKIAIATDNHLGFMERDPIRGNDSFEAFEEFLKIASQQKVDLILLGGDLFHDNKPSRSCLFKTMALFRKYCLGNGPISTEYLSDDAVNFAHCQFSSANFIDGNFNVKIPVFTIHGNHDDPSGEGNLAALDLLSVSGMVNYFGKQSNADDIVIEPILLGKGTTRLALYGLGNIRDERLFKTFNDKKVVVRRPVEYEEDWFNLLIVHQNRIAHTATSYLPEKYIQSFMDLVLWGHEHECRIDPEQGQECDAYITQPGSSVATALSPSESVAKHIGILRIKGREFHIEKIRLKTVRPFVLETIELNTIPDLVITDQKAVNDCLRNKVMSMIEKAKKQWAETHADTPNWKEVHPFPRPLIRLKVEYTGGFSTFSPHRFGQPFLELVANPADILLFYRKKVQTTRKKRAIGAHVDDELPDADINIHIPDQLDKLRVEDLVAEYLNAQQLTLLPENEFSDAVKTFVDKEEKEAIRSFVNKSLRNTQSEVAGKSKTNKGKSRSGEPEVIVLDDDRVHVVEQMFENVELFELEVRKVKQKRVLEYQESHALADTSAPKVPGDSDEPPEPVKSTATKKRATSRASPKASRAKSAPKSRSKLKQQDSEEEASSDEMDHDFGSSSSTSRRVPARSSTRAKARAPVAQSVDSDEDEVIPVPELPVRQTTPVHAHDQNDYMDDDFGENAIDEEPIPPPPSKRLLATELPVESSPGKRKRALPTSIGSASTAKKTKTANAKSTRTTGLRQMTLDSFSQSQTQNDESQGSSIQDSFAHKTGNSTNRRGKSQRKF